MPNNELTICGRVERIIFENPTNFYRVMVIEIEDGDWDEDDEITITGIFPTIHLDTTYNFYGKIFNHQRFGEQFACSRYEQLAPTSEEGLITYLSSERFPGIGQVLAGRIVDRLGIEAVDQILADRSVLEDIQGLSKKAQDKLFQALYEHQGTEKIFLQLNKWGFGPGIANRIYSQYQEETVDTIRQNPYQLIQDVEGVGFQKADQLAEHLGIEDVSSERLVAALYTAVAQDCFQNGNTYVMRQKLYQEAQKLLESSRTTLIEEEELVLALDRAVLDQTLFILGEAVMIPSLYYAELGVVNTLAKFLAFEEVERFEEAEVEAAIQSIGTQEGLVYDDIQIQAIKTAVSSPISIITGGPGTGKTTLVKGIIKTHASLHAYDMQKIVNQEIQPIRLAAPTGRAAKRLEETSDVSASTIHRLIGFNHESEVDNFHPDLLEGSLLIIDEMSMVDTWLMNWLVQAIPYNMQVVLVGDVDQLPSVGPGQVFYDLIHSGVIPTIALEKIYRQSQESSIVELAHAIRKGQIPANLLEKQKDRSYIPCATHQVPNAIEQIVQQARKNGYTQDNLQVLAPMYRGQAGVDNLNKILQNLFNPPSAKKNQMEYFETIFRVNDKVLQLVNNTDEGVFNGDIGQIEAVVPKSPTQARDEIYVSFNDEIELAYERSDLDQLTLAYCTTIHKAQGSEYPLVILPLVPQFGRMLRRDLVYTAITRATKVLILLGDPQSFAQAVQEKELRRQTNLMELLQVKFKDQLEAKAKVKAEPQTLNMTAESTEPASSQAAELVLTEATIYQIDPMIGMEGVTPYSFM